ncbi:MAG: amidase [Candidatus Bathyarchaeota archaeon]|nr:MAG: amidase [Candidatus Bathyarchaeota archaeon]
MGSINPSDLAFASATEVAGIIQRGKITSQEIIGHIFDRIESYNPEINAIVTLVRDEAMARARAADEALSKGEVWGPLHGVPCTAKDCFEIAGVRTTAGSPSLSDHFPEKDATAVARLKAAGAVIIGHTNVPIMAGDWQSYNKVFGTTNNPWDPSRTPGGSTGGGAAALAAGLSYLSLGSDIGGSIRLPAHFCGVYGHKPSINVAPLDGYIPKPVYDPPILYVAGSLARSAEDLRAALEIVGGPGPEEAKSYSWDLLPERGERLSDYRLGYVVDHPACSLTHGVKEVILDTVEKLKERGVRLEEGWPEWVEPVEQYTTYRFLLASTYAGFLRDDEYEAKKKQASKQDGTYEAILAKAWTAPHKHFLAAQAERREARAAWQEYFVNHDAFLLPPSFLPAFPHDHSLPYWGRRLQTPEGLRNYEDIYFWISFATLTGLPATVAPVGRTKNGLPVGIQIIGPYLEDATPIDIAAKISDVIGGFTPPEGYEA